MTYSIRCSAMLSTLISLSMPPTNSFWPFNVKAQAVRGYFVLHTHTSVFARWSHTLAVLSSDTLAKSSKLLAGVLTPWTMALCPLYFLNNFSASTSHADTVLSALPANRVSWVENAKDVTALVCDLRVAIF